MLANSPDHKMSKLEPPQIEKLRVKNEDKYCFDLKSDNVDKYLRRKITGSSAIYKASLDILLCHFADFHKMTLEVLCRKHGLDFETVLQELKDDKEYKEMITHPLLNTLFYASEEDFELVKPEAKPKKLRRVKIIQKSETTIEATFKNIAIKSDTAKKPAATQVIVKKDNIE